MRPDQETRIREQVATLEGFHRRARQTVELAREVAAGMTPNWLPEHKAIVEADLKWAEANVVHAARDLELGRAIAARAGVHT